MNKKILIDEVKSLKSYKYFSKNNPPSWEEYSMSFSYYANNYIKNEKEIYSFSENLQENSIVIRLFIDDGSFKVPEDSSGKYNIFFDICNNKILEID